MLEKIEFRNPRGSLLSLPLNDPSSGIHIQNVEGLGPVKATIVSSGYAQMDGTQYHTSRREARNLTVRFGLDPDYATQSVYSLRQRLYNYFMTKTEVQLRLFMMGGLEVDITGRVESCEPDLFTQEPAVDVSIICFDPDFIDRNAVVVAGMSTSGTTDTDIDYIGSVETGFLFQLNVDRSLTEFSIYMTLPNLDQQTFEFSESLVNGDIVKISTVNGDKGVTLTRTGVTSPILYAAMPQSAWIQLEQGINKLRVYADGAGIPYTVTYYKRYGGL